MKDKIAKLASDISALTQKITDVEKELRAKDLPFMQVLHYHSCFIELGQLYGSEALIDLFALFCLTEGGGDDKAVSSLVSKHS